MDDSQVGQILDGLSSKLPEHAWSEFLQVYAPLILQVIRSFERDIDHSSGCFLFVCEGLSRSRFHRLRRFRLGGSARFSTWLRVVVRNLCLDWHRKEFGRQRIFESMSHLWPWIKRSSAASTNTVPLKKKHSFSSRRVSPA